ncbi:hypothetical protein BC828DRAFT_372065 [Blastocladiella britannica]|nr:hypothetical protein BC828DRAFT_372065 [Blastocladiella britannica]
MQNYTTIRRLFSSVAASKDACARLSSRRLLALRGDAAVPFLQGLVTNHMPKIARGGDGLYTAFLSPHGRVLYDAFVYPQNVGRDFPHPAFLVDVHADHTAAVTAHLRRYRLRTKVEIEDVSEKWDVWAAWGPRVCQLWTRDAVAGGVPATALVVRDQQPVADIGCYDPRWAGLGVRAVVPKGSRPSALAEINEVPEMEHTLHRLVHGIPEGTDYATNVSLPLESNLDYMNAIDFRKGCYVGQELTIRTYHTGVVRKRIVPVVVERADAVGSTVPLSPAVALDRSATENALVLPPAQSNIMAAAHDGVSHGRPLGKWCAGAHNVGLALFRLEMVDSSMRFPIEGTDLVVRPYKPAWWPTMTGSNEDDTKARTSQE